MQHWTITFLILAVVVGILEFSGLAGAATAVAQILFVVFLVLGGISGYYGVPDDGKH